MKWIFTSFLFTCLFFNQALAWQVPTQILPANQALVSTSVMLDWNAVASSTLYDLEVDTTNLFNSSVKQNFQKNYLGAANNLSDTQHQLNNLFFGDTYYWRIRARQGTDISAWSAAMSFRTIGIVPIQSPANAQLNMNTGSVTLDWYSHPGANRYQVQIDTTNLFNSVTLVTINKTYTDTGSNAADTRHVITNPMVNRVYFWRVRAINTVDTSAWHLRWFSTGSANIFVPNAPTAISPLQGLIEQATTQTFVWSSSTYANQYQIYIDTIPQLNNPIIYTLTDTSVTVANLLPNHTYYWYVRAFNTATIVSAWSPLRSFKTITFIARPNLVLPSADEVDVDLNTVFRWNYVPYATHYRFTLSSNDSLSDSLSIETSSNQIFMDTLRRRHTYYWSVQAFRDTAFSSVPAITRRFTMAALSTPQPILPIDQAQLSTNATDFSWTTVDDAQNYELRLSLGQDITHSYTLDALNPFWNQDSLLWGASYMWNVRAVSDSGNSAWSANRNFLVINPVGIEQTTHEFIQLWPNPSNGKITIHSVDNIQSIGILRSDGSFIRSLDAASSTGEHQLFIDDVSAGIYFIRIQMQDGRIVNRKLMKQ